MKAVFLSFFTLLLWTSACHKTTEESETVMINGAGATFPYPLYSKWIAEYNKLEPRVQVNYQSIGSGGGIRQITERTVEFGASDTPMNQEQLTKAKDELLHVPTTLGAVVLTYNLPNVPQLKLSPEVLAGIFLGEIKQWNDKPLQDLNGGVTLPAQAITVVHRSDGSGTTAVFTGYLSLVHEGWKSKVGTGTSVNWPVGLGAKGNEGVTGQIKTTAGTIGYTELAYAKQNNLPVASIKNQAGQFAAPTLEAITAAAASLSGTIPDDLRVSIVNAPGVKSYPISAFTYVLVYARQPTGKKSEMLVRFLWWAVHQGQQLAPALNYATLPVAVIAKVEKKLRTISVGAAPLTLDN
jgi:phosphate transport system substrate-binding protein